MLLSPSENQDPAAFALHKVWPSLVDLAAGRGAEAPPTPDDCPLWSLYAPVALGRADPAFVIGQLGQSLDGRVATATGKSRYINGPEAIRHLHRLRALVDAVVVGIGTVIADDPQLNVREVEGPCPARVVIDPNFRLPAETRMGCDGVAPVFAIQSEARARPDGITPLVVPGAGDGIAPADIVAALAEHGFKRILIEGGAATVSTFLAAGALHRLHLSIAPMIIGSGPVGINLPPIDELACARRPRTVTHHLGADVLFDCAFEMPA
ncbi:MAG: Bifunctional deaminase-reductase domain protein [Caulobacteraceae bacterium]|nr:Bifunctional deaminase-reductase domain protein [Caulobacteraceae bacterium]